MAVNVSKAPAVARISSLESRVVMTRLLLSAVVGVCVGAIVGGLAFGALGTDTTATAFLRLHNPADLAAIAGGASQTTPDDQKNTVTFVAGEIAYLSGEGFAQAVARKMAKDEPTELNVSQASESAVVTMSYGASSADEAVRTVQAAIDLYRQELQQRVDAQVRTILPTLGGWQEQDAGDVTRMQDLQRVRESIELQSAAASTFMVVQPPTPNHPSSQQWLVGALLGALVGGAGVVMVLLARRRRAGRGSLAKTLGDGVDGVLLPVVNLDPVDLDLSSRDAWTGEQLQLARTLYAQCPSAGQARTLLVIGASPSSGSSTVAALLETASAESQPVPSVSGPSGQHSRPTSAGPSTTQVVAGGAVGESTLTQDVIAAATAIVLVAGIDIDSVPNVLALRSATASTEVPVVAVFTHRRRRSGPQGKRRSTAQPLAHHSPEDGVDEERSPL